jgi:putative acetyltransferase
MRPAIRAEQPDDRAAIRDVVSKAFGQTDEADLVDALRREADPFISLVATDGGTVVGHIAFSPITIITGDAPGGGMGLAPMAVVPELQNRGIGSRLVREGLEECRRRGADLVVVLGHADYYPRFGFTPGRPKGLTCEYPVPDEVFMVLELTAGALSGRSGLVQYHPAFARF